MKVLLVEDIKKLGWVGDVVEVEAGYARNYLLPEGLAVVPTAGNLKAITEEKTKRAEQRLHERKRMEAAAAAVEGAEAVIAVKANEQGHLFGSVTENQIAANLREQGFEVADDIVQIGQHIKEVGTHSVSLKYADDLKATVKIVVVAQKSEEEAPAQQ
jgi:large subunit ribosomal protein L9